MPWIEKSRYQAIINSAANYATVVNSAAPSQFDSQSEYPAPVTSCGPCNPCSNFALSTNWVTGDIMLDNVFIARRFICCITIFLSGIVFMRFFFYIVSWVLRILWFICLLGLLLFINLSKVVLEVEKGQENKIL